MSHLSDVLDAEDISFYHSVSSMKLNQKTQHSRSSLLVDVSTFHYTTL